MKDWFCNSVCYLRDRAAYSLWHRTIDPDLHLP